MLGGLEAAQSSMVVVCRLSWLAGVVPDRAFPSRTIVESEGMRGRLESPSWKQGPWCRTTTGSQKGVQDQGCVQSEQSA